MCMNVPYVLCRHAISAIYWCGVPAVPRGGTWLSYRRGAWMVWGSR